MDNNIIYDILDFFRTYSFYSKSSFENYSQIHYYYFFIFTSIFIIHLIYKRCMYKKNILKVEYTSSEHFQLSHATPLSAGLDIYANQNCTIEPYQYTIINTGIKLKLPTNHFGLIANRSSMALKKINILGGIIDNDYRGEIKVILYNNNNHTYYIKKYDKIAQLICIKTIIPTLQLNIIKNDTVRGINGLGSSGK